MDEHRLAASMEIADRSFTICIADTPALRREAYRLRHQVYCIERGYEPCATDEESDLYDAWSRHALLRNKADDEVVGTVRVIGPNPVDAAASFPMQQCIDQALLGQIAGQRCGEISRFAISKQRRAGWAAAMQLRLALMRGVLMISDELRLTHWCAVMEPTLLRMLRSHGIHFHPVGSLVEYHGLRQPSYGTIERVLGRLHHECYPVWEYVTDGGALCRSREIIAA